MEERMQESSEDVRWQQRFANFTRALAQLTKFIDKGELNEFEEQGLIQAFEYTHELASNTLKDFIQSKGTTPIYGSKDATREAFRLGLITDGEGWMAMIRSRNKTLDAYNQEVAQELVESIQTCYFSLFQAAHSRLRKLLSNEHI
jgi:nucleotidyltransferase substrate binding protein (TIGR01987 family)